MLELSHKPVQTWFEAVFPSPTRPQSLGWPAIAAGNSTLILAPTGTGKTLAAFLWAINRLMFSPVPAKEQRCRVLYISPIKALAVDIERNLRAPLVGISQMAHKLGMPAHEPAIAIRSGDTPANERAQFSRRPTDILITTPESLYLLLTSNPREALRSIETVIVDEIHAIAGTKRGSHLALSLERLEHLCARPLQRIGLSATQRPLDEVAHFLGGALPTSAVKKDAASESTGEIFSEFESHTREPRYRPVTIVDASEPKRLNIRVEVPIDDMTRLDELDFLPSGPASQAPAHPSIWSAIHPKLLELIRAHRSTLIFVNNRRLAERIAGAVNDLAGETLVRAHHGSVAAEQRAEIEDRLKLGTLRGLVATSSLELGIDMGAIDVVVQIEAPPSVASGMQRVGRSNHQAGGTSTAVMFPKYRGDLLACATITRAMYEGKVEPVHYPRNALDVLAQQIVAMVAMDDWRVDDLFATIRQAAPYAALTRSVFESVLDMLAGRYPSDDFAELRPRLTWDRLANRLSTRQGARVTAVNNAGTIPDRGLYGVFSATSTKGSRVGELDEEMVFESRAGDTIILGATTWRIEEITHDRVLVSPAPGEPGKMPFWKGDGPGRPPEFGQQIGELTRSLLALPKPVAFTKLIDEHSLDPTASENLLRYLDDQTAATDRVPSDQDILIERCRDEFGDWRVCVLTPFGTRVHAPWCMAATAKLRAERGIDVESMWSDDGFVIRLPDGDELFDSGLFLPSAAELKDLVLRQLGSTSLFAAKFREAAARALLLPRRRAGLRAPLWQQRKRASDLLAVASRYPGFPILLETYRECVRDVFDLPATIDILRQVERGAIRVTSIYSDKPSPFASTLLFSYIANYIYDGDAPLAERRAQALAIDQSQLEQILGSTDLRELLDAAVIDEVESQLQSLEPEYHAGHADGLHDLLLKLGDLSREEILARTASPEAADSIQELLGARRAIHLRIAGQPRYIPVEYAARYRDALGIPLPPGLATAFLAPVDRPLIELLRRYARTHGPFTTAQASARFGLEISTVESGLRTLHGEGKLLEGEFRPGGIHDEWCDPDVLQQIRRKTLAKLRHEVEPAAQHAFERMLTRWQGVAVARRGVTALVDTIEVLQGATLLASDLEREILPSRVADYEPAYLDALLSAGEIVWIGRERSGDRDGRIALYLADALPRLLAPEQLRSDDPPLSDRARLIEDFLRRHGASFFAELHQACGSGYPGDTQEALWQLVWSGRVTNDTFLPIRNLIRPRESTRDRGTREDGLPGTVEFLRRIRARSGDTKATAGRWSLVANRMPEQITPTEWAANTAQQLLARYGVVMRETAIAENIPGGYPTIYPAFRTMEDNGWARRGMFVAGLGAAQFALNSAIDVLRSGRKPVEIPEAIHLAASDPANPYGTLLPWPRIADDTPHMLARASGASVILVDGHLSAFLRRKNPAIRVWLPENEPERTRFAQALAKKLAVVALARQEKRSGVLIQSINDTPARDHPLARFLEDAGFVTTPIGLQMRRTIRHEPESEPEAERPEALETA